MEKVPYAVLIVLSVVALLWIWSSHRHVQELKRDYDSGVLKYDIAHMKAAIADRAAAARFFAAVALIGTIVLVNY